MGREAVLPTITENLTAHAAAVAWEALPTDGARPAPRGITPLKEQFKRTHKSGVYRLELDDGHEPVIAKRCRRDTGGVERLLYERVLPQLPTPQLRFYGSLSDPDPAYMWLFFEDAGEMRCAAEHAPLAARWLADLHVAMSKIWTSDSDIREQLPQRGAAHYADHLRNGRSQLLSCVDDVKLPAEDRQVVRGLLREFERARGLWGRIESISESLPRTLVHGDFVSKNLRVRTGQNGTSALFALDWETAGWGPPAADIGELGSQFAESGTEQVIAVYTEAAARTWLGVSRGDVEVARRLGRVFRLIACVRWAGEGLGYGCDHKPLAKLRVYEPRMREELAALEQVM